MENDYVMKRLLSLFLLSTLLIGCNKQNNTETSHNEPHYAEVEELHIQWNDLFSQSEALYCAYVYSVSCTLCSYLRKDIVEFAKSNSIPFYFIYPSDDIPFVSDPAIADSSLGAKRIEDVYCFSTPTLIEIKDKEVINYLRDYYDIKDYMKRFEPELE